MKNDFIARASVTIDAPPSRVWNALVDPEAIKAYLFGTTVASDWSEGSPITWDGQWKGKTYQDKGVIERIEPERLLQYTHYSPLSGVADEPENYHTVTIELTGKGTGTLVCLAQDNNASEQGRQHSEKNWGVMLAGLKAFVEK